MPLCFLSSKPNKQFGRKLAGGTETANILVGQVDFLTEPLMLIVRLKESAVLGDMTEVACPTRFIFLSLGPPNTGHITEYEEIGRGMAAMFTDKVCIIDLIYNLAQTCQYCIISFTQKSAMLLDTISQTLVITVLCNVVIIYFSPVVVVVVGVLFILCISKGILRFVGHANYSHYTNNIFIGVL